MTSDRKTPEWAKGSRQFLLRPGAEDPSAPGTARALRWKAIVEFSGHPDGIALAQASKNGAGLTLRRLTELHEMGLLDLNTSSFPMAEPSELSAANRLGEEHPTLPTLSKYQPLADHLVVLAVDEARFSFSDIERLIGSALPPSALKYHTWWANSDRGKNGWSNLWKRAGWVRDAYSLSEQWVTFQRAVHYEPESDGAREGYELDRRILASARNAAIAEKRRQLDNHTCQACGFRLEVQGRLVIDVHHLQPLRASGETITTLEHLASLCPTCHRIAHLRRPPYSPNEIHQLRIDATYNLN
jgi:hypothetical protein